VIRAVISDFGGVVTMPLIEAFERAHAALGIPLPALRKAMDLLAARAPEPPLFKLERGQMREPDFIAMLEAAHSEVLGHPVSLDGYGARLMGSLEPNEPLLAYYRSLRDTRGVRLAICTNNVREWHDAWVRKVPVVEELFELVVDSSFVGVRKPEPAMYALMLERLDLPAEACAFVDDVSVNVDAAREAGMHGIHFRDTEATIAALERLVV
jgi:epoxide hydrolase-like predicted phosphatase